MRRLVGGLLAALVLLAAGAAKAQPWPGTLLFQGGEQSDFKCIGGLDNCVFRDTGFAGAFRLGWARGALGIQVGSVGDPPVPRMELNGSFAGQTTIWIHGQFCEFRVSFCSLTTNANVHLLGVYDDMGNPAIVVRATGGVGQVKISSRTAGGAYTDLVTCPAGEFPLNSLAQFDLEVTYGVAGVVRLYVNGVDTCSFSGDTTNGDGATTLTGVYFGAADNGGGATGLWSEILIGTADTRSLERKSAYFLSNGNTVSWGGDSCTTLGARVDYDDSSYAYTGAINELYECVINSSIPAGIYEGVVGLGISGRALSSLTGPVNFQWITRIAGTEYSIGGTQSPVPAFNNGFMVIQTTNPATGLAWQISDFASPFNLGMESLP